MKKIIPFLIAVIFLVSCAPLSAAPDQPLRVVVPPNPNAIPLFVALQQHPDLNVTVVPVPGVPELAAAVQGGQADVALFFSAAGAKLYNKGALSNLRLWDVNVWRALYLVTGPDVQSLDDLRGQKILASFQGGAPDLVMRAAMRQAGYDPDADFQIEYLPSAQVKQLFLAGEAAAALLPEPQVTLTLSKGRSMGLDLKPAVDLQTGFGSSAWNEGLAPLGGIFVTQETLGDAPRRARFEAFAAAYAEAADYIMSHPDEAAAIASQGFADTFGAQISADGIAAALQDGRLVFESRRAVALRPDLDDFLAAVIGKAPDDAFYVP